MTTIFDDQPDSLLTLSKTPREMSNLRIMSVYVDLTSGFLEVSRASITNGNSYYSTILEINSTSYIQWEKLLGTENLGYMKAFLDSFQMGVFDGISNFTIDVQTGLFQGVVLNDGQTVTNFATTFPSVWSDFLAIAATPFSMPDDETSVQYGDTDTKPLGYGFVKFYDDYLVGGKNSDQLFGLLGNDTLDGGFGDDELYGGYGVDVIRGGAGNDQIYGEQGNDKLYGGDGDDYIDGGLGSDTMEGGSGNDTYIVDNAKDLIYDNSGTDTVLIPVYLSFVLPSVIENAQLTGNFNSNVTGNLGQNILVGNDGNNILSGAAGNDSLVAGFGDDTILGGSNQDTLVGGAGADIFQFLAVTDSTVSAPDSIRDFSVAQGDKIDLSVIDAKTGATANDSFTFVTKAPTTAGSGANGIVWYSNGYIYASINTDIQPEFKLALLGVAAADVNSSIFIL